MPAECSNVIALPISIGMRASPNQPGGFQDSSVRLYDLPALLGGQPESMDVDGQDEAAQVCTARSLYH